MRVFLILLSMMFAAIGTTAAHESRPGYLELDENEGGSYDVHWKKPAGGIADGITLTLVFPDDCRDRSPHSIVSDGSARSERWSMICDSSLAGRAIGIDGLQSTQMNVLVRLQAGDGASQSMMLSPAERVSSFAAVPSAMSVVRTYFVLGVEHIWSGLDHLLFVLTLMMLADGWRRLLALITAFTVAHSITLSLASLGYVTVLGAPVEALIALSIVLAAAEGVKPVRDRASLMARAPWVVAFAFGLLHGFGFAGALAEIGLPQSDVLLSLLFFNIGVEVGQVAFVVLVVAAVAVLKKLAGQRAALRVSHAVAYGAGSIAALWFFERTVAVFS